MHSTRDALPRALTQWTLVTSLGPFWFHQMNKNENKQLSYFNSKKKKKRRKKFIKPTPIWRNVWLREGNWLYHGWRKAPWWMHHFLTFNLHNLSLIIWQLSEDFGSREKQVRIAIRSKTEAWVRVRRRVKHQVANQSGSVCQPTHTCWQWSTPPRKWPREGTRWKASQQTAHG